MFSGSGEIGFVDFYDGAVDGAAVFDGFAAGLLTKIAVGGLRKAAIFKELDASAGERGEGGKTAPAAPLARAWIDEGVYFDELLAVDASHWESDV
jgi:hypothetical protein